MASRLVLVLLAVAAVCVPVLVAAPAAQAETRTVTLRSQPFRLGGFQTAFPKVRVRSPRRPGYVTRMDAQLVYENGRRVPISRVMLHHIVFINDGRRGGPRKRTTCGGRGGEPFWGTGEERQPLLLPPGYGYRLERGDRWRMQTMLMSHSGRGQRVRVQYRLTYVTGRRLQRVKPLWLRANGCARHPSYDVNGDSGANSVHRREYLWRMPISGRIVAASAHLHGSARGMTIRQTRCRDRTIVRHDPLYGQPGDEVYRIRPILHEPGPIATGHFQSRTGIPVRRGERLRVTAEYDGSRPRPQVMAISHVYVAPDARASRRCSRPPADARIHWTRTDGRRVAPRFDVPLTGLDERGRTREIEAPPGAQRSVDTARASVVLRSSRFVPANLSVPLGATVTWRFADPIRHNVFLAIGPRSVSSPNRGRGYRYSRRFETPGTYKLFCYLHPVTMHQVVQVRDGGGQPPPAPAPPAG